MLPDPLHPAIVHFPIVFMLLLPIAAATLAAAAYALRIRSLTRRGRRVPAAWRRACFYLGLAALVAALISPLDRIAETRVFYAHMIQHLTIGEVAPLLILLGLSGAVLRPLLALPAAWSCRSSPCRSGR